MKRYPTAALILGVLVLGAFPAFSEILDTGVVPGVRPDPGYQPATGTCAVLWFGAESPNEILRLSSLGFTITQTGNPADLNLGNLMNFQVLVVAYTGSGVIGAHQGDIQAFVDLGGGLLIHQPNCFCAIDYAPVGFGVTISDVFWCGGGFNGTIVDGSHPVTFGLVDADLAGDFDLVGSIGAGYTLLAQNAVCSDPAVAAGNSGSGRVVFETGNASPNAADPGSDLYWSQVLNWLCTPGPISTEPASWGEVKALYQE